jgi:hypothetical protein
MLEANAYSHTVIRSILNIYEQFSHKQERDNEETFERVNETMVDTIQPMVNIDSLGKWLS